jgi:hypothetical protein
MRTCHGGLRDHTLFLLLFPSVRFRPLLRAWRLGTCRSGQTCTAIGSCRGGRERNAAVVCAVVGVVAVEAGETRVIVAAVGVIAGVLGDSTAVRCVQSAVVVTAH